MVDYSYEQFESDMAKMRPRFIDTWVLPGVMIWFATKAKGMPRWPRRILFGGGVYMVYRNYFEYKNALIALSEKARGLMNSEQTEVEAA